MRGELGASVAGGEIVMRGLFWVVEGKGKAGSGGVVG